MYNAVYANRRPFEENVSSRILFRNITAVSKFQHMQRLTGNQNMSVFSFDCAVVYRISS